MKVMCMTLTFAALLTMSFSPPANAREKGVLVLQEAHAVSVIRDSSSADGAMSGVLLNSSKRAVRDVELLVRHQWLWKNERHPGADNPGRVVRFTVPGEIAPGGTLPFSYTASPPLPVRSDGRFRNWVEVAGFTEVGQ